MAYNRQLEVPANIGVAPLLAECPELNPAENISQFMRVMRGNWLSNRIFTTYDDVVDHCYEAWNTLIDQPWRIVAIGRPKMGAKVMIHAGWYESSSANQCQSRWRRPSRCAMAQA